MHEEAKRKGKAAIEKMIEEGLNGCSVTAILIGYQTYDRDWVNHELRRSFALGKGMLGIYIHNIKNQHQQTDYKGENPFSKWQRSSDGVSLADLYPTYDGYGMMDLIILVNG